jgi:ATP-dependent DNA ligase
MDPVLVDAAPTGDRWLHEIKQDGYRTQLVIDGGKVRAFTKTGADWTDRYSGIARAAAELPLSSAIIDGEAIVQNERGLSDFHALQRSFKAAPHRIVYIASICCISTEWICGAG